MGNSVYSSGTLPARLTPDEYEVNFSDINPGLSPHEAMVEADRCYFCYDAPCVTACPTGIDIPLFIRQISTGTPRAAAKTIFDSNILGGMCARSCPTENLCEGACVREVAESEPVEIGRLQRFATDTLMDENIHPYTRAHETGKIIAVIGSGPAGLACSHRLAMHGHNVEIFEEKSFLGGLNQTGIATYKTVNDFAQQEVEWLLKIGGIKFQLNKTVKDLEDLHKLTQDYDAVFVGSGLGDVNRLNIGSDKLQEAVTFIEELRLASDYGNIPIGKNVVVIGGGMTAIDAGVQSKLLGSENVTIAYRRSRSDMGASEHEINLALKNGVKLLTNAVPLGMSGDGTDEKLILGRTEIIDGKIQQTEDTIELPVDQVFMAIGQKLEFDPGSLAIDAGKIVVDSHGRTSVPGIWAGGDCTNLGEDLTVTAVAQGRDAAEDIHRHLSK